MWQICHAVVSEGGFEHAFVASLRCAGAHVLHCTPGAAAGWPSGHGNRPLSCRNVWSQAGRASVHGWHLCRSERCRPDQEAHAVEDWTGWSRRTRGLREVQCLGRNRHGLPITDFAWRRPAAASSQVSRLGQVKQRVRWPRGTRRDPCRRASSRPEDDDTPRSRRARITAERTMADNP